MLKLKDKNKKLVAGLINYKDLCIESILSTGDKKLSFSLHKEDKFYNLIEEECYIETKEAEFVIKARDVGVDYTRFDCVLNLEELEANIFDRFESVEQTITASLNLAIVGTGWTVKDNTLKKKRTVRCTNKNALEIVQEIKKTYRVDIVFNTLEKQIEIHEHLGEDKGTYFIDSLNLTALQVQSDSYKFATRIIAEGKDGLTFSSINNGKNYVENYQYSNKVKPIYWKDERYTIKESLLEDAKAKLKEISKPFTSYNASILNLAELNPKYKNILDYRLGDTITLISRDNKVKDKQRIVKTIEYHQDHSRDTVELANAVLKFEDIQQENQETTDTVSNITVDNGTVDGSTIDSITTKQIEDFKANVIQVTNLHALNADIDYLKVNKADMQDVNIVKAKIGTLETTKANITELNSVKANLEQAIISKASITDLNAVNGKIGILESKTASIDNLLAGNLTANNFKTNSIVAGSGIIADGAIGSAQISSLSVNKLEAGEFITSKHKIVSADGTIEIVGNQILINRNNVNRVVLGEYRKKDGTTEYGLLVRAKDGQTIMLDGNGVHNAGITDGAIDNNKVADNANISGNKLDINSVIREVNTHGTETIKGTKVTVGDRTLDVELSTQKNTITEHSKELSTQKASIQALDNAIKLKVDSQTFTQSTTTINNNINKAKEEAINSAKAFVNSEITTVNSHLNKATSEINILKEKIESKVSQSDIDKSIQEIKVGGRNLVLNREDFKFSGSDYGNPNLFKKGIIEIPNPSGGFNAWNFIQGSLSQKLDNSKPYCISLDLKANGDAKNLYLSFEYRGGNNPIYAEEIHPTDINNVWKRFTIKMNPNKNSNTDLLLIAIGSSKKDCGVTSIEYRNLKIEEGTISTDDSEAPEDLNKFIVNNIKTITDKISTVESNLTQENNSIKASVRDLNSTTQSITTNVSNINRDLTNKINSNLDVAKNFATSKAIEALNSSKSYTNAEITTVNSKVHNLESNLNILSDRISSKVSQSDIDKSISEVNFNSRNYIKDSNNMFLIGSDNPNNTKRENGKFTLLVDNLRSNAYCWWKGYENINSDSDICCSVDIKINDNTQGTLSLDCGNNSFHNGNAKGYDLKVFKKGEWKRISSTGKATSNFSGLLCITIQGAKKGLVVEYRNFKVSTGLHMPDWTPAPEDTNSLIADNIKVVDSKISDVSSSLEQTKNSITQSVNNLQSQTTTLNGKIVNAETRLNSVEAKITDTAIINTVRREFYSKGETDNMYSSKTEVTQLSNSLEWKISTLGAGNLIKNSSFNGGFDCWERFRNPTLSTNTDFLPDRYGKMISIEGDGGIFQRFPTIPGEKYTVSFYAEADRLKPLATTIGIEGINLITLVYEPNFKRWSFTFTATSKEHTFIAYLGQYGKFYLGRVMVTQGSILQEYREGLGIYSNIAKFDTNGFTVESSSTNTRTITDSSGFRVQDKSTGENLLEANVKGVSARGGRFFVDGPNGNYTLMWGRDIVINGQRALVGTHSHPEASLQPNKVYLNYNNDFKNGVEIGGKLTNNTFDILSLISSLKSESGFRKLSDGFMIVWGKVNINIKDGWIIEGTIPFHTKFPNACFLFNANLEKVDNNDYWTANYTLNSYALDKNGGRVYGLNLQKYIGKQGAIAQISYIAIGC
ncbi:KID repeat-containing protein [Clostridium perfringens]|uniref:KID repeat-containing protein n=1 Tax=Clostridium perfringens TaxID=1502 RepID=A0A2X3KGN0_CLOPF|nr:phage tail protein [Clostridium perfringens]SQC85409.1 KID repeat-containing protein [Clostridium perfringens]